MNSLPSKRIAVIAVHGVADQKPGESAEAIAAVLLGCTSTNPETGADEPRYEAFSARGVHVPLAPAVAKAAAADFALAEYSARQGTKDTLRQRVAAEFRETKLGYRQLLGDEEATQLKGAQTVNPAGRSRFDAGLAYMRLLLSRYTGEDSRRSYVTSKLAGSRKHDARADKREVDVYEMYWADLSRLGGDPLRFFSALYQVVLHLSELGRRALEDALTDFRNDAGWKRTLSFHETSVRVLALPIPILNLILLLTVLGAVVARVAGGSIGGPAAATGAIGSAPGVRVAAVAMMIIIFTGLAYWYVAPPRLRLGERPIVRGWWTVAPVSMFAGAALGYVLVSSTQRADILLIAEWWLLAYFIMSFVLGKYERVRPGASSTGRLLFIFSAAMFAWTLVTALNTSYAVDRAVEYATLWTVQLIFQLLALVWGMLIVCGVTACLLGASAVRRMSGAVRARAKAAFRTSRLALAISASAMLGIIVVVWSGIVAWGVRSVSVFDCMQTTIFRPLEEVPWLVATPRALSGWLQTWPDNAVCANGVTQSVHGYFRAVLLMTTTSGLPASLLLVVIAFVLLLWMAMPSVKFEGNQPEKCANVDSTRLGQWMSQGLNGTRAVTHLWWASVFVVLPLFALGDLLIRHGYAVVPPFDWILARSRLLALPILQTGGSLVAASAAAIFFGIAKFGGSALDVVLDVDNYLRELPTESPPRARIAERYSSLLRYVANERSVDGRPYDAVVVIAHSLGGLITVDLLRYLTAESEAGRGDASLAALGIGLTRSAPQIPISIFTMGNPVRQLLNRFFPHQYDWVREIPDNSDGPTRPVVPPVDALVAKPEPSTRTVGVARWSNAYRSGDYVGRSIWLEEWYKRTDSADAEAGRYPEPIAKISSPPERVEMCIGVGAHTHYWDTTAPDIRDHLDQLIVSA